jgi:Exostosin family
MTRFTRTPLRSSCTSSKFGTNCTSRIVICSWILVALVTILLLQVNHESHAVVQQSVVSSVIGTESESPVVAERPGTVNAAGPREKYREQVRATQALAQQCTRQRRESNTTTTTTQAAAAAAAATLLPNISLAYDCLQLTTPDVKLEYPEDAEEHYNEIRMAMAPWAQTEGHIPHEGINYNGPWIENYWISTFEPLFDDPDNTDCLSTYFGPFIPIFVPFIDRFWYMDWPKLIYPPGLVETLLSLLRPNVPYIAVTQSDVGLYFDRTNQLYLPNLLILSSGGFGHIPIPLLKQFEPRNNNLAIQERAYDVSYVGQVYPHLRTSVHAFLEQYSQETLNSTTQLDFKYYHQYGGEWKSVMRNSRFSLVPRGFGRTAYHLMETVQMGLIPVYIYRPKDASWIPYANVFDSIGYSASSDEPSMRDLVTKLQHVSNEEIERRERRIESFIASHFSYNGTIAQIRQFLLGQSNDLVCQPLPKSVI